MEYEPRARGRRGMNLLLHVHPQADHAGLDDRDRHGRLGHGHGDGDVVHGGPELAQGAVVREVEPARIGAG